MRFLFPFSAENTRRMFKLSPREEFDVDSFFAPAYLQELSPFELDFESSPSHSEEVFNSPASSPKLFSAENSFGSEIFEFPLGEQKDELLLENFSLDSNNFDYNNQPRKKRKLDQITKTKHGKKDILTKSQKLYMKALERQVKELKEENCFLKTTVSNITSEKKKIQEEVVLLQEIISSQPELVSLYGDFQKTRDLSRQEMKQNCSQQLETEITNANNVKTGLMLMVVLFSFGLFLSTMDTSHHVRNKYIPKVEIKSPEIKREEKNSHQTLKGSNLKVPFKETKNAIPSVKTERIPKRVLPKRGQGAKQPRVHIEQAKSDPTPSLVPLITEWKSNTTYLICSNVSQMTPPENCKIKQVPNAPMLINFMIPPDSLSGGSTEANKNNSNVLEVTCQVLNVNMMPLQKLAESQT